MQPPWAARDGRSAILERAAAQGCGVRRPTAALGGQGWPQRHPRARYGARLPCTQATAALGGEGWPQRHPRARYGAGLRCTQLGGKGVALAARYSARLRCTQPTAGLGGEGTILERAAAVYAAFSRPRRPGMAAAPSLAARDGRSAILEARGAGLRCTQAYRRPRRPGMAAAPS